MDGEIKTLNIAMKSVINSRLNSEINRSYKEECLDLASCLSIFKIVVQNADHRSHIMQLSENMIDVIRTGTIYDIENSLDEFVKDFIPSVVNAFEPIANQLQNWIQEIRSNSNTRLLSKILGKVIMNIITHSSAIDPDFQTSWNKYFSPIFSKLNIINRENTYLRSYLFSILCDEAYSSTFHSQINKSKFSAFENMFGDVKNFKFIKNACKVSDLLEKIPENPLITNPFSVEFIVSKIASSISNQNSILNVGDKFLITPTGLNGTRRPDKIIFVGKHSFCDIRLPQDELVDDLSFAILCTPNQYYIIDCSKISYLKEKLEPNIEYEINQGLLIDIAQSALINVIAFENKEDNSTGDVTGTLHYEFLIGELANPYGPRGRTASPIDGKIILGRGIYQQRTDIVISENGKVSGHHMEYRFAGQKWKIVDLNSKNGTFIAYKTYNQYQTKDFSDVFCLFETKSEGGIIP